MEAINCKLFIIPKLLRKHIYLLFFLLGALFRVLIPDIFTKIKRKQDEQDDSEIIDLNYLLTKKYFEIIRNVVSALLLGIPHLLNRMRNRDEEYKKIKQQTYVTNKQKINFIYNDNESSRIPIMLKIIFIIASVDVFCQLAVPIKFIIEDKILGDEILYADHNHLYFLLFFDIFARYFFSRWILRTYFYIHHYLSFLLNLIGLIPISFVDISVKIFGDDSKFNFLFVAIISVQLIMYSFEDIMNKVAFRALSILPYTLIFYNGLFQLGYFIIISILFFSFGFYDFKKIDWVFEVQYSICFIPFNILRNYYLVEVIDKFSAQHMALLRVTECSIIFIYNKIACNILMSKLNQFHLDTFQFTIQCIGFFFLIMSSLIHNEIIIINHPKLKAKTQVYLDKDADKEQNASINSDTCISSTLTNSQTNLYDDLTGSDMS